MTDALLPLRFKRRAVLAACALPLALAACSDRQASAGRTGQWIAKVDGREITVHQVNAEAGGSAALSPQAAQQRAVAVLVDRQLLIDAALQAKQDRDPETMQAIELARDQNIAQAYLRKTLGTPARPTAEEVGAYFNDHPELFAKRKQYDMRQLSVDTALFDGALKGSVEGARSLDEVEAGFAARNVRFDKERALRTGADLPPPLRAKLDALVGAKPFVIRTPARVLVATLADAGDAPMTLQEATPQIEQALALERARAAATAELDRLRRQARIEYRDGYGPAPAPGVAALAGDATASIDRAGTGLR